jgi:hypothetical protein
VLAEEAIHYQAIRERVESASNGEFSELRLKCRRAIAFSRAIEDMPTPVLGQLVAHGLSDLVDSAHTVNRTSEVPRNLLERLVMLRKYLGASSLRGELGGIDPIQRVAMTHTLVVSEDLENMPRYKLGNVHHHLRGVLAELII